MNPENIQKVKKKKNFYVVELSKEVLKTKKMK